MIGRVLAWLRAPAPTPAALMRKRLAVIVPGCFALGAGMEMFMIKTGFYSVATRKEAERRLEAADLDYQRYRAEKKKQREAAMQQQQQSTQPAAPVK